MKFKEYYRSLSSSEREKFAKRADTSTRYIEIHLLPVRKVARQDTIHQLAEASEGNCTVQEVFAHFHADMVA